MEALRYYKEILGSLFKYISNHLGDCLWKFMCKVVAILQILDIAGCENRRHILSSKINCKKLAL